MKPRTAHSFGGMRRYLQQSRTQVFIFVEGRDLDPQVYGAICASVCANSGKSYEIVIADRINGAGGGKGILTDLHQYLAANNSLVDRTQAQAKLVMIYLDKDVGDLLKTLKLSAHIVYTTQHCIENHLFIEGDFVRSLATAGSLDLNLVRARVADANGWRNRSANCWREWVALCILAEKLSLSHPATYRRASTLNNPADSPTDPGALAACVAEMEARSGLSHDEFGRKLAAANRIVSTLNQRGGHDLVFKGKWYTYFALRELELTAPLFNRNGAPDRLMGSLIATTNFDGQWVEHFRKPLRDALAAL